MDNRQPTGTWSGHPQFTCRWCPFDALDDPTAVDDHEQAAHADAYIEALLAADAARVPPALEAAVAHRRAVSSPAPEPTSEPKPAPEPAPTPAHEE